MPAKSKKSKKAKPVKRITRIQLAVSKYRVVVDGSLILLEDWGSATIGELTDALNEVVGINVSPLYLYNSLAGNSRLQVTKGGKVREGTAALR